MQRMLVLSFLGLSVVGCSDDGGNKLAPDTALVEVPPALSNEGHVRILFEARGNANAFFCKLDANEPTPCVSPFEADVDDGDHTFEVAAALNQNVDETPAIHTWRIDTVVPETTLISGPPALDNSLTPEFTFDGADPSDGSAAAPGSVTFECSLDGDPFQDCTSPHSLTAVDGLHSFAVRAKDAAGNVDPTPAEHAWTIDATAPETVIDTGPAASSTTGPTGELTFSSPDVTATFECAFDADAFAACTSPLAFTLGDGAHTFAVRAKDPAGLVDPSPATRTWTVDAIAPTVTITGTPPNPSNDPTPTFSFTSPDATATFECQVDGVVTFIACASPFTSPTVANGARTFRVRATDPVGNTGAPAIHGWVVDTIAPTVTLTAQPAALSNDTAPTVAFTLAGAPVTVECGLDMAGFVPCTSAFTFGATPDGAHTITVRATDAAGNVGAATTASFTIDTIAPTVMITSQPAALSNDNTPTVVFVTGGAPATTRCRVDAGALTNCSGSFTPTVTDGAHTITVIVTDLAGNAASATTSQFTVDTVAPVVTLTGQPLALSNDNTPTVTFTTSGAPTTIQCRVDAGAFATCVSGFSPPVSDGAHTITVRALDAAGNIGSATTASFTVDTVAPTVTITAQPGALTNDNTPTVTFTTAGSPTTTRCRVNAGALVNCSGSFTPAALADGTYTMTIVVTDAAGNQGSATTASFTIDTVPPTVSITGQPAALSNDNTPTVVFTTGGGPTSIQCRVDATTLVTCTSPHTFGTVADGAHTITVVVRDAAGNQAQATTSSFTIDTTPPTVTFTEVPPARWPVNYFDMQFAVSGAATIQCSVNGGAFAACTSPLKIGPANGVGYGAQSFRVRGTDSAGNVATRTTTWTGERGMVLHYPWEQGDTDNTSLLRQRPSHSPDGALASLSTFVGGWAGSALGGATSFAAHTYPNTDRALSSSPDGTYTASFWVRHQKGANGGTVFSTNGATGGLTVTVGGAQVTATVRQGTSTFSNFTAIAEDRWVHIGLVTTGPAKGLQIYVDGNFRAIVSVPTATGFDAGQNATMTVGSLFGVDLDDLRFYNAALTGTAMCEVAARGFLDTQSFCTPLSPGFEIDFERGRPSDTGIWRLPHTIPNSQLTSFGSGTLGGQMNLTGTTAWGYIGDPTGLPTFRANAQGAPGRSFTFSFVPKTSFGRLIDFRSGCVQAVGTCGIAVNYVSSGTLQVIAGTPTAGSQKTVSISAAGGVQLDRFNTVVVTEQRSGANTTSLTVYVNGVATVIPFGSGSVYAFTSDNVGLVQSAGIVVDEYEFWPVDLSEDPEMLCENGHDGEFDIVTDACLLTAGP